MLLAQTNQAFLGLDQFRLAASLVFPGFMSLYMTLNYYEAVTMKTQMIREVKQSSN